MAKFVKCTHMQTDKPVYVNLDQPVANGGVKFTFSTKEMLVVNETAKQIFEQIPRG